MEKKYLLPAMNKNIEVDSKDCWKDMDEIYDFLINNLKLYYAPNESIFEGGSNAMPHMFEQMLIFHKAFFDEDSSDHDRAVAEWRAILSIMALQKVKNIRLDVVRINLSGKNENSFLKAAHQFLPEDTPVLFNTTWDLTYVVRVSGVPVAMFSPITLVCPAKLFLKKVKELQIQWFAIEKINSKEELQFRFKGEKREIWNLMKWLKRLRGNLNYSSLTVGKSYSKYEKVISELDSFIQEYDIAGIDDEISPIQLDIYHSMNNSVRKEYDFLNNCCGVTVNNPKMRFLIERYQEDIFEDKVLVLVYDDAPDTIQKEKNINKLKKLYKNILEIESGKPIIEVYDTGGRRLAACVFLPFKNHFVEELIQNEITPNEFFGLFTAVYNFFDRNLEITLQIKEFPYYFEKRYPIEDWQYLYGKNLDATYIWPTNQVDTVDWKTYYIYTEINNDTEIEVSLPEAVSRAEYTNISYGGNNKEFQLCKSNSFPAYLCYTYQGVSGFLPIWTTYVGADKFGPTAHIIIDMGHSTTSISIVKDLGDEVQKPIPQEWEELKFKIPHSTRIAGNENVQSTVKINFVPSDETDDASECSCIKNMLHSFTGYTMELISGSREFTFENGQILFDSSAYMNEQRQSVINYINVEFSKADQYIREKVHIFIEQLLLYIFYQITVRECTYADVYLLHPYIDNIASADDGSGNGDYATKLGELKGLWKKELYDARQKTGINSTGEDDIITVKNYEALMWYVYEQMYRREIAETHRLPKDSLNIGINIGWKHTNIVFLSMKAGEKENDQSSIRAEHIALEYAGRNISMLKDAADNELGLKTYPQILNILVNGNWNLGNNTDTDRMLREFAELFEDGGGKKDITHYQGLFDLIAMKIEEAGYKVSRDVFNNAYQFRYFLMMITYNIMLLFLEVGMLIRKYKDNNIRKINLFLGGNGALFLKWISNDKDISEITMENADEKMILHMTKNLIEHIAEAAGIDNESIVEIKIMVVDNVDQQLVQGTKAKMLKRDIVIPEFVDDVMNDKLDSDQCRNLVKIMNDLCDEIFPYSSDLDHKMIDNLIKPAVDISAVKIIENERKEICRQVIDVINNITI